VNFEGTSMAAEWPYSAQEPLPCGSGKGLWWGRLIKDNPNREDEEHPLVCIFPGCSQMYSIKGANATRVRNHLLCTGNGIKKCLGVKGSDQDAVRRVSGGKTPAIEPSESEPSAKRQAAHLFASTGASGHPTASSSLQALEPTADEQAMAEAVHTERLRAAGLSGMFKHMLTKEKEHGLHKLWAKAAVNANIPPHVFENDYFRDAIIQTSMAAAPYQPPHRGVLERNLIPAYDVALGVELREVMGNVDCRVLGVDGWDDLAGHPILGFMLYTERGDEFLGDVDMSGKDKDADSLAALCYDFMKKVNLRYPPKSDPKALLRFPSVFGNCTDNPTVMRAARLKLSVLLDEDESMYQPFFFGWPCLLHGLSSLLTDTSKLPFIKSVLKKHKHLTVTFRGKQWLRSELGVQQALRKSEFMDSQKRFRPLTLLRPGSTRIASLQRSVERNIKLKSAFDGVCAHPDYRTKCGISLRRWNGLQQDDNAEDDADGDDDCSDDEAVDAALDAEADDGEEEEDGEAESMSKAGRTQQRYIDARSIVRDDAFWRDSADVISIIAKQLRFLKHSDESRSMMGFVWPMMYSLSKSARALLDDSYEGRMPLAERKKLCELIDSRWIYVHSELHSAAYVLNPRFVNVDHLCDPEVRDDFIAVLTKILPTPEAVSEAMEEYTDYRSKLGMWSNPIAWVQATSIEPAAWWKAWGSGNTVWLGLVAPKLLSLAHGAGGVERTFSAHGRVNSDNRGSQKPETIARHTRAMMNQRLLDRQLARGKQLADARERINVRIKAARSKQPPVWPKRVAPKPYPLALEDGLWSCEESDVGTDADELLVRGPAVGEVDACARRSVPAPALTHAHQPAAAAAARPPQSRAPVGAAAAAGRRTVGA
jgi:hypothetical protein